MMSSILDAQTALWLGFWIGICMGLGIKDYTDRSFKLGFDCGLLASSKTGKERDKDAGDNGQ